MNDMVDRFDTLRRRFTSPKYRFSSFPWELAREEDPELLEELIEAGEDAVPFLLNDIRRCDRRSEDIPFWLWVGVLAHIVDDNQVGIGSEGCFEEVRDAWTKWGVKQGWVDEGL